MQRSSEDSDRMLFDSQLYRVGFCVHLVETLIVALILWRIW